MIINKQELIISNVFVYEYQSDKFMFQRLKLA